MDPRLIPMLFENGDYQIAEHSQAIDSPLSRIFAYYFRMMSE